MATSTRSRSRTTSYSPAADPRGAWFPPVNSSEVDLLSYRDRIINPWSVYRNQHMGRIGLAFWYFLGKQWAELDTNAAFDGVRGSLLRDISDGERVCPVTNECDPIIEAEVIALCGKSWTPKAAANSNDPKDKAAAQVTTDWINYRLRQLSWPEKRHQLGLFFAAGGNAMLYTGIERSYMDLVAIGSPSAVYCASCKSTYFSANVPVDLLKSGVTNDDGTGSRYQAYHTDTAQPVGIDDRSDPEVEEAQLQHCPNCASPTPLQPLDQDMDPQLASTGVDPFGRALGVDSPRAVTNLEVDLPWERYPENGGAHTTPDRCRIMGRRKIRSLAWLEERYPHRIDEIEPDSIHELLYNDPILGGWESLGAYSGMYDAGILDCNVNVDELIEQPSFRTPLGRYTVQTKDVVLYDGDLLEEMTVPFGDETRLVYVPQAMVSDARFKIRPTDYWGTTALDHEISKQNRLNGLDAQVVETRLRMGSPNLAMPEDMWPEEGPTHDDAYGSGFILLTKPSVTDPNFSKPIELGSQLMPDAVYEERDRIQADIRRSAGPSEAAQGQPVKNVGTTSGLQLMVEQDAKMRSLRESELTNAGEKSFTHLAQIEWTHCTDETFYEIKAKNKPRTVEWYKGAAFRGQTNIEIETSNFVAHSVMQREAAREALADHIVVIDGPLARRRLAEMYGMDSDINEDTTVQVDHAERIWVTFEEDHEVAVQDPLDDPMIHHTVLALHLQNEEGEKMARVAGWPKILPMIAGWEDRLTQMELLEQQSIAFYGGRLSGDEAAVAYAQAIVAYNKNFGLFDQQQQLYQQQQSELQTNPAMAGAQATVTPPVPPTKPMPPIQIPVLKQARVLMVWESMIKDATATPATAAGSPPPPSPGADPNAQPAAAPTPGPPPIDAAYQTPPEEQPSEVYKKFRALVAAYKLTMMAALAPPPPPGPAGAPPPGPAQPPPPSPGTGATNIPGDKGSPAMPSMPPATGPLPGGGAH